MLIENIKKLSVNLMDLVYYALSDLSTD